MPVSARQVGIGAAIVLYTLHDGAAYAQMHGGYEMGLAKIPNLRLVVTPQVPTVARGQPVRVTVRIENLGSHSVVVNCAFRINDEQVVPLAGDLFFKIEGPGGHRFPLKFLIRARGVQRADFVELALGGACDSRPIDLSEYYGVTEPGRYRIVAGYRSDRTGSEFGTRAVTGSLPSEPIDVEVLP